MMASVLGKKPSYSDALKRIARFLCTTALLFGSRTASFMRPLLSVDVSVCLFIRKSDGKYPGN